MFSRHSLRFQNPTEDSSYLLEMATLQVKYSDAYYLNAIALLILVSRLAPYTAETDSDLSACEAAISVNLLFSHLFQLGLTQEFDADRIAVGRFARIREPPMVVVDMGKSMESPSSR